MKELSRDEMEMQISDYVLERLDEEQKQVFEHNLPLFPDIQKECTNAKQVLSKMEDFDMERAFGTRTAGTISFIEGSLRRQTPRVRGNKTFRFAIPLAIIIAIFIFYSNSKKTKTSTNKYSPSFIDFERGINKSELDKIYQKDFDTLTEDEIMQLFEGTELSYPAILEQLEEMNYEEKQDFFEYINHH